MNPNNRVGGRGEPQPTRRKRNLFWMTCKDKNLLIPAAARFFSFNAAQGSCQPGGRGLSCSSETSETVLRIHHQKRKHQDLPLRCMLLAAINPATSSAPAGFPVCSYAAWVCVVH